MNGHYVGFILQLLITSCQRQMKIVQLQSPVSYLLFQNVHKDSRLHLKETKQLDLLIPVPCGLKCERRSTKKFKLRHESTHQAPQEGAIK